LNILFAKLLLSVTANLANKMFKEKGFLQANSP